MGCVVIIYSNIYQCPFVFDDIPGIKENAELRDLSNYLFFGSLLKPREIVDFTFALNYKFGKLNVFGYHLINVLIHIINGFLAYFLAHTIFRQLSKSPVPQDPHFGEERSTVHRPPSYGPCLILPLGSMVKVMVLFLTNSLTTTLESPP